MSKARNNIPRAAIHVGAPAKSFSAAEGYEPERRGWDERTYLLKNQDTNNHYDYTRKHLNFEIGSKGQIVPLGSNPMPLHERLQKRLDELGFKPYKGKENPLGNSDNSPNCTVGIIVSGDHNVLSRLAFGNQNVDFTLQRSNTHIMVKQGIRDWAMDTYQWACDRWGAENIIGFDVHLDETTPHIHIQTIPVTKTKARGRASVKYVHKDDKSKVLSHKEWKKLPEEIRSDYVRTEVERREKECVSYARVWGEDKYAVGRTYYQMHTDYHNGVGHKYGLERGDDITMLPDEERRGRVHKNKAVLEAERKAKDAIVSAKVEKQRLEQQRDKLAGETQSIRDQKERLEGRVSQLEEYAAALDIKEEDLIVPTLKTNPIVKNAYDAINTELEKPIPTFGSQKQWREERRIAIKGILTNMQTEIFNAKEAQKEEILKLGKSLYNKAMKDVRTIVEQNKRLMSENGRLAEENDNLRKRIATIDENAVSRLRTQKDAEIKELQKQLDKAESEVVRSGNIAYSERQRADKAEEQVREMLAVPEIKAAWDTIQQNKKAFVRQLDQWIDDALKAIAHFAAHEKGVHFSDKQANAIAMGVIAKAFRNGLDITDKSVLLQATRNLLDEVDWSETSEYKQDLTRHWTEMFCQDIHIPQTLVETLALAAGGRGMSTGGGGSNSELTNWDGTKKKTGWGIS